MKYLLGNFEKRPANHYSTQQHKHTYTTCVFWLFPCPSLLSWFLVGARPAEDEACVHVHVRQRARGYVTGSSIGTQTVAETVTETETQAHRHRQRQRQRQRQI